jgi:phosphatidylglycerol---prolipoprotein diacylglyceryl transferase
MIPKILHLYGPLYINSYGFFIALSILLFLWVGKRDAQRKHLISDDQFLSLIILGIASGVFGGRVLYLISNWYYIDHAYEMIAIWNGGFSILGSIICILLVLSFYLYQQKLNVIAILDFAAIYAPMMQSISRVGCFFAGCCYGKPTVSLFGVIYTHPLSVAPQNIALHPAQLYSSFILFSIFLFLYHSAHTALLKPGQLTFLYLILASMERFALDFIRGDKEQLANSFFSLNQWIALLIFLPAMSCFFIRSYYTKKL